MWKNTKFLCKLIEKTEMYNILQILQPISNSTPLVVEGGGNDKNLILKKSIKYSYILSLRTEKWEAMSFGLKLVPKKRIEYNNRYKST